MVSRLSWGDRARELRNRLLSSPRFQSWAIRLPGTRAIARRRARKLFDLCAGFVYSQVLLACVQLRLFDELAEGPRTASVLARRLALPEESCERLLRAAVSLGLLERRSGGRFGLGGLGAAFLGNPGIAAMVAHHPLLYSDLSDPVALLRGEIEQTELGRFWPYARAPDSRALGREGIAPYTTLMSASQSLVARQVLDAYPLERHRCLLDVGGGDGAFLETVASRAPDLRLVCFDLPPVAELAQERFSRRGLSHRATAVGGDFHSDPLPEGADVVSLVRIICDQDDDEALALLRAVRHAMPPDAVLLLAESMAETEGAEPIGDAYFGLYLLAMGSGRARSATELRELVQAAGFRDVRIVPTRMPLQAGLLVARS